MIQQRSVFLETSAMVRLLKEESGWKRVARALDKSTEVIASALLTAEVERAIRQTQDPARLKSFLKMKEADPTGLGFLHKIVPVRRELLAAAGSYEHPCNLRTADAIHVATFEFERRFIRPELLMLTCDRRVKQAVSRLFGPAALIEVPEAPLKIYVARIRLPASTVTIEIRAESLKEARSKAKRIAVGDRGSHPRSSWINPKRVSLLEVRKD